MRLFFPLLILMVVLGSASVSVAYGAEITYRSPIETWYSYDCTNPSPNVFTKESPGGFSAYKYFGFIHRTKCYSTMLSYDISGLDKLSNTTQINYTIDSRASIVNHLTLGSNYNVSCKLLHFNSVDILAGAVIQTPDVYQTSFACTGLAGTVISNIVPFDSSKISQFQNGVVAGNTTFYLMVFPLYNATMLSNISSNNYQFGLQDFQRSLYVNGDGFNCALITGSGMCDFQAHPWKAIAIAYGADYIGPWFYVLVFFPFPFATYLITRNGTYAGFIGLGFMLFVESINPMIFEIALTMILISASFGFYEILKRRLLS